MVPFQGSRYHLQVIRLSAAQCHPHTKEEETHFQKQSEVIFLLTRSLLTNRVSIFFLCLYRQNQVCLSPQESQETEGTLHQCGLPSIRQAETLALKLMPNLRAPIFHWHVLSLTIVQNKNLNYSSHSEYPKLPKL